MRAVRQCTQENSFRRNNSPHKMTHSDATRVPPRSVPHSAAASLKHIVLALPLHSHMSRPPKGAAPLFWSLPWPAASWAPAWRAQHAGQPAAALSLPRGPSPLPGQRAKWLVQRAALRGDGDWVGLQAVVVGGRGGRGCSGRGAGGGRGEEARAACRHSEGAGIEGGSGRRRVTLSAE